MNIRKAALLTALLALAGCALPPNGTGAGASFGDALGGDHHIMDSDCIASGLHITSDGATRTVDGTFHIDCEPQPHSFTVTATLQWKPAYPRTGGTWVSRGDSAYSTTIPDSVGETFTVGPANCQEGRWRIHIVADGMTHAENVRHDVVNGPHPSTRIKDCNVSIGPGWSS